MVETHLRPLDMRKDLMPVADLIEICFSATMDPDGREYLRQMRQAGRDPMIARWAGSALDPGQTQMTGFVWDEEGIIVGNLTLIPFYKQLHKVYLIANVAVHPNYRRRGIGRALTQSALNYARLHGATSAWLQVREGNQTAENLYRSLGFIERSRRTTWINDRLIPNSSFDPSITITSRYPMDWPQQKKWLQNVYPQDISWNLPFQPGNLEPGLFSGFLRMLFGDPTRHWAARQNGHLLGVLTWEPSHTYADNLWLAVPPETEDATIRALLPMLRREIDSPRPAAVNFPYNRATDAFIASEFKCLNTLIWMERPFTLQPNYAA